MIFLLPCEVNDYVDILVVDLSKGEGRDVTPNLESFPKNPPHFILIHLPREALDSEHTWPQSYSKFINKTHMITFAYTHCATDHRPFTAGPPTDTNPHQRPPVIHLYYSSP